ncbi:MAG: hypothetical protein K6C97_02215 [Treponema sp.]|nr:hypothetical protein [Treponema sp.]
MKISKYLLVAATTVIFAGNFDNVECSARDSGFKKEDIDAEKQLAEVNKAIATKALTLGQSVKDFCKKIENKLGGDIAPTFQEKIDEILAILNEIKSSPSYLIGGTNLIEGTDLTGNTNDISFVYTACLKLLDSEHEEVSMLNTIIPFEKDKFVEDVCCNTVTQIHQRLSHIQKNTKAMFYLCSLVRDPSMLEAYPELQLWPRTKSEELRTWLEGQINICAQLKNNLNIIPLLIDADPLLRKQLAGLIYNSVYIKPERSTFVPLLSSSLTPTDMQAICAVVPLCGYITTLKLTNNAVNIRNLPILLKMLKQDTTIDTLILHTNPNIDDDCAKEIADMLRINRTLECVNLHCTRITAKGAKLLFQALEDNKDSHLIELLLPDDVQNKTLEDLDKMIANSSSTDDDSK